MKPQENLIFSEKKAKIVISVKTRNFSRSRMTKREGDENYNSLVFLFLMRESVTSL